MKTLEKKAVRIRRMVSDDVMPILEIWWADIPEKEKVAAELQGPLDLSFIAEYEGVLVGFILAKQVFTGMPMTGVGDIYLIAVNPEYRQHGIGTLMIEALEKHCRVKSIRTIRAHVPEKDAGIIDYFKSVGFRRSDIVNYDKIEPAVTD